MNSYKEELQSFKKQWSQVQFIDLIFSDINATPRGKRIPINDAGKLSAGVYLPSSTISLNIQGGVVEEAGLGQEVGEPDHLCLPVPGTLKPTFNPAVGQLLLTMQDSTGTAPYPLVPRQILSQLLNTLHQRGQFPVMAIELEFYLLDKQRNHQGTPQAPINPIKKTREASCEVYNLDNLDDYSGFLADLSQAAANQGLKTSGALAESAPGQFEINFHHQQDILEVCDHVIFTKRLIRQVAEKHGFDVTFMAKPFTSEAGNGEHVHISLMDESGNNLFSDGHSAQEGEPSELFYQSLAALSKLAPESMSLLAPNVNSYRRFCEGMYTPLKADWGINHRGVALRVPTSDSKNRRIEHRIAGADVNPYLLCAVILAGIVHAPDIKAESCPPALDKQATDLPRRFSEALNSLKNSEVLTGLLGREFIQLYITCKESELSEFEQVITPKEIEWMLYSA